MAEARIKVSEKLLREFQSLSIAERLSLVTLVERIARNPFDPDLIDMSHAEGDFFASTLSDHYYLYWTLDLAGGGGRANASSEVRLLALIRARKTSLNLLASEPTTTAMAKR